jgi:hypothetical protein
MVRIFRTLILICLALLPALAAAEEHTKEIHISPIDAAKLAIRLHDYDTAQKILNLILKQDPSSTDALFLMAESDSEQSKFDEALPYYRKILSDHPDLIRVRLDLARAEFEAGEDESADYNFRLALAGTDLPDTVVDNIGHYLAAIQSRKTFSYNINISVAPDSNINAAAASNHVTLFGLPFTVPENSMAKSGIGVVNNFAGERFTPLSPTVRLRTGASFYAALYPGHSQFDDIQARASLGPQWLFGRGDVSALGVVGKRWYGGDPYTESVGGRLEGDYNLTKQLQLSSYLEGLSDSFHSQQYYNGYNLDQGNFLTYYFTSRMLIRLIGGVGYQSAQSDPYEYWYWHFGFGVQFEFPWGITAYAQPDVRISPYSGIDPFFLTRRTDRLYAAKLSLYKRDWNYAGFSPVLSLLYTNNVSNIPIYKFHRIQAQLGVTKQF